MENQEKLVGSSNEDVKEVVQKSTQNNELINNAAVESNTATAISKPQEQEVINLTNDNQPLKKSVKYGLFLTINEYLNKNKQDKDNNEELEKIDEQARNKWFEISTNVYTHFALQVNTNKNLFNQFVQKAFANDWDKITTADELVKEITNQQSFLKQEKKRLKILMRKFFNGLILCFCFLLIGLLFLPIYFKNRKVIRTFNETVANINQKIQTLNQQKIDLLTQFYSQYPTVFLLNNYLNLFGIRILHEYNKLNIHNLIPNSSKKMCTISYVIPFKVANHLFVSYEYCEESIRNVTTTGSIECEYTTTVFDVDGNPKVVVQYETVIATHVEPTPFRDPRSKVYTTFDENADDYAWTLTSVINEQKNKKISAFGGKHRKLNDLANTEFNQNYVVGEIDEKDLKTLTVMHSYLTPYSQSTILKIGEYYNFNKFNASFVNGHFMANSLFNNYAYCTWNSINWFLKYKDEKIGGSETLDQIEGIFLDYLNQLMYTPSFLWSMDSAATNMLNFAKDYDWTIGSGYTDNYHYADLETVISHTLISACIRTNQNDAFKGQYFYHFNSFETINEVDIYVCDLLSYYATKEVDIVMTMSAHCGMVGVPVPYTKYHEFSEQKIFFVYKNTSSLLGTYPLMCFQNNEELRKALGKNISNSYLICTPELKIIVINEEIQAEDAEVIADFIKQADLPGAVIDK